MVTPYAFTDSVFTSCAYWCACAPSFWARVGRELQPERVTHERAARVLVAVREIVRDTSRPPTSIAQVSQRLRSWVDAGRLTLEEWETTDELLDLWGTGARSLGVEALVAEVRPQLRRDARMAGVREALDAVAKNADLRGALLRLQSADRIGDAEVQEELVSGFSGALDEIDLLNRVPRLPTGIPELDTVLGGGAFPAAANVFASGTKGGKSMFLSGVAATALAMGLSVFWATLENPTWLVKARLMAAMTGIPTDEIRARANDRDIREAWANVEATAGAFYTKYYTQKVTTWTDIATTIADVERTRTSPIDVMILDYVDLMRPSRPEHAKDEYTAQGFALMEWRAWLMQRMLDGTPTYGWTVSQGKRSDKRATAQRLDGDGLADSHNKARALDLLVTGTKKDNEVELHVALARLVQDGAVIGPFPHAFATGRYVQP